MFLVVSSFQNYLTIDVLKLKKFAELIFRNASQKYMCTWNILYSTRMGYEFLFVEIAVKKYCENK